MTAPAHAPASLSLEWRDETIRVESEDSAALRWLDEFLSPAFDGARKRAGGSSAAMRRGAEVRFAVDAPRFDEVVSAAPSAPTEEIDLFTRDGEFERVQCWRDPARGLVMRDRCSPVVYLRSDSTPVSWSILAQRRELAVRLCLMRVPREIATTRSLRAADLPLHASSIGVNGVVIAIAGPRRSGKTSMLLHLLQAPGVSFVSNDRLMVEVRAEGSPHARGMPTIITLREGTLDHAPAIRARMIGRNDHALRTIEECRAVPPPPAAPGPRRISAAQLCAAAEVTASEGGPLRAVLLPRIDPGARGIEIRRLSPADAVNRLRASLLLASMPERTAAAFDRDGPQHSRDGAALDAAVAMLAARTPCFGANLGPEAFDGAPARLIDSLLA